MGAATVVASGNADVQLVAQYQVRDAQDKTIASGVATVAGIPLGTVKGRMRLGLLAMRRVLDEEASP